MQEAFTRTHRSFYAEKPLHGKAATHSKLLHAEAFTQRSLYTAFACFCTQQAFTQRSPYTEKLLDGEAMRSFDTPQTVTHRGPLHTASSYTEKILYTASFYRDKPLQTEAFTQRSLCREKLLHAANFYTQEAFTHRQNMEAFTHRKLLHREAFSQEAFTHGSFYSFYTEKLLHTQAFWHDGARNCSSKTGSQRQSKKKDDFEALF